MNNYENIKQILFHVYDAGIKDICININDYTKLVNHYNAYINVSCERANLIRGRYASLFDMHICVGKDVPEDSFKIAQKGKIPKSSMLKDHDQSWENFYIPNKYADNIDLALKMKNFW